MESQLVSVVVEFFPKHVSYSFGKVMLLAVITLKIAGPNYGFSLYDYGSFAICFKQNLGTFWGLRRLFVTRPV